MMFDQDILCDLSGFAPLQMELEASYYAFSSLTELIALALHYKQKEEQKDCTYFFRGEGACFQFPTASLFVPGTLTECENEYYQAALSSAPDYFYSLNSTFDRLSQMRHYAFPTRILDITENILTAWFMALDSWYLGNRDKLCEYPQIQRENEPFPCPRIVVFRVPKTRIKDAESDLVTNLSCLAKVKDEFTIGHLWHEILQERYDFHENVFWENFKQLFENWCVRPRMTNPRVRNQQGAYVLFGLSEEALSGSPINGQYDRSLKLKKSSGKHAKMNITQEVLPDQSCDIQVMGYLMPSQGVLQTHRSMKDFVQDSFRDLGYVGVAPHTVYVDDFEKHAAYWKQVIEDRHKKH